MVFYNGHCCGHCAGTVRALYGHCVLPAFSTCWEGRGSRAHEAGAPDGGQGRRRAISAAVQARTSKQTSKRPGKRARGMALAPAVARAAAIQGKLLLWGPRANRDRTWKLKSNHIYRSIVTVAGTAHRMRRAIARTPYRSIFTVAGTAPRMRRAHAPPSPPL